MNNDQNNGQNNEKFEEFTKMDDHTSEYDPADVEKNKLMAGLAMLFVVTFFLPLVVCPESRYGKFWANNALLLLIASVVVAALNIVPIVGNLASALGGVLLFIIWLLGVVNAFSGKAKELMVLGKLNINLLS